MKQGSKIYSTWFHVQSHSLSLSHMYAFTGTKAEWVPSYIMSYWVSCTDGCWVECFCPLAAMPLKGLKFVLILFSSYQWASHTLLLCLTQHHVLPASLKKDTTDFTLGPIQHNYTYHQCDCWEKYLEEKSIMLNHCGDTVQMWYLTLLQEV